MCVNYDKQNKYQKTTFLKKTQVKFNTKSNALLIWTIHLTDAVDDNKYK